MSGWVPIAEPGPVDRSTEIWDWSIGIRGPFSIPENSRESLYRWSIKWTIQLSSCVLSSPFQSRLRGDEV